ncbi:recq-mediated genome instability protein 1 rmi1 [Holotrichia oblita]|uniref:Recq-mediated genome instability protein 1 rmi1 n=1 Tax=Holotrichia oblita TaxID=644536 RepID=A0ACB9SWI7_HOLOL|nr:recq-mediated genome instability protein 1 rmi1 [Holotrichia oblita]
MQQEILETKQFFESNNIKLSDFWLQECIQWFHQELNGTPYTKKQLHTNVYEQWLQLDFRDIEVPQIPPNMKNAKKLILNKSLSLQMMSCVDISKPKYSQLQKIKNLNALTRGFDEEKENAPSGKRMLQLTLTDGVHEICAIEYKTVPKLDINLTPGAKIKINAPITVRRGQILLEPQSVQILGGEVEEILISHAAENILARSLDLPENPHPGTVNESITDVSTENDVNIRNNVTNQNPGQTMINRNSNRPINVADEDEVRIAAEVEMLLETERDLFEDNTVTETKMTNVKKDKVQHVLEEEMNEYMESELRMNDEIDELLEIEREVLTENVKKSENDNDDQLNSSLETEIDLFNSIEMDNYLDKIEADQHIPLETLVTNIANNMFGKYKVRAKFQSVVRKLSVNDDKWVVQICIVDSNSSLAVFIDSCVLNEMIGFTPKEALNLRYQAKNGVQMIMNALDRLKSKFIEIDCVMDIEYNASTESPIIVKFYN